MKVRVCDDHVEKFLSSFDVPARARIAKTIHLLESFGASIGMPHSRSMGSGLFELRIRGQFEIRIFYMFFQNEAIVLHGYKKQSRKTPKKELEIAKKKMNYLTAHNV